MTIRIIGDVHGLHDQYVKIANDAQYSICVGDVGFEYSRLINELDPDRHKFVGGNHDNYDIIDTVPHYLGHFGSFDLDGRTFWFIRGAFSIDKDRRIIGRDWWEQEELTYQQGQAALDQWKVDKPDVVISHTCPDLIVREMGFVPFGTRTGDILNAMWDEHKPKEWYFGHFHKDWTYMASGTQFRCIDELSWVDV